MYEVIEFSAVVASAIYGILLARQHRMDFVGVFCLAFIVAFGGGTLRDLFLDQHPLFWIRKPHYSMVVFAIAIVSSVIPAVPERAKRFLSVPDALGLGLFSVAGATVAIENGTSYFIASLLGAVTGTFGGVIGDVICNRVPSLFSPAPLFATCSFLGSWVFLIMNSFEQTKSLAAPVAIILIFTFRLAAIRYNLHLPSVGEDQPENSK